MCVIAGSLRSFQLLFNVLFVLLLGFLPSVTYVIAGCLLAVTIVGFKVCTHTQIVPRFSGSCEQFVSLAQYALRLFKMAALSLLPFGQSVCVTNACLL